MEWTQAALLGLIQGLTEFLPVSSSGHLVILQYFLDLRNATENITFDIFLHLATLIAVVWVYRKDLKSIAVGSTVGEGAEPVGKWRLVGFIVVSLIVTGIVLPFRDQLETMFETISGVRVMLLINAVALAVLPLLRKGNRGLGSMGWIGAVIIGLAQAAGVFPGISRSGSTIMAGLLLGLKPSEACRYSFLLSIPSILAAAIVQVPDAITSGFQFDIVPMVMGFAVALASGLVAIPLLIGLVEKGKLWGFAIYCGVVGAGLFFVGTPVG